MEHCDYDHPAREVRVLPQGGGGNTIVCSRHYLMEMRDRLFSKFPEELIQWKDLKPYNGKE